MANDPEPLAIMWFRKDLRLYDNPAFVHSAKDRVLPLFILDDQESYHQANASKWWLYKSLNSLKKPACNFLKLSFAAFKSIFSDSSTKG